jgi:hypothetical protein
MSRFGSALVLLATLAGCPGDDGGADGTGTEDTAGDDTTASGTSVGDDGGGGEVLGCPDGAACRLVLVAQTLDDRVEIFSPDDPDGAVYRGAIDVDLKPNTCDGCNPGDNGADRLDEPFGLARAGGFLHVIAGHFPTRDTGTLLSFPLELFEGREVGGVVSVAEYWSGGPVGGVVEVPLQQLEPIYLSVHGSRLLIGTFANDLFASEDTWTESGKLLVLDADDPAAGLGITDLGALMGGACNAAGEVVPIAEGVIGVACDGNEAVALLDISGIADLAPADAAASITGTLCDIPGATDNRRVRHLAPDGAGGVLVAEGPTPLDLLSAARLWHFDGACGLQSLTPLDAMGDWQLGNVVALPGAASTWLFVSGAATSAGHRGVFVAQDTGASELQICGPIAGFDPHLTDALGEPLEPVTVAVTADASHLAVGVAPFIASADEAGYGKVLWATLDGAADPCAMTATVVDLTDGSTGAPVVDAADPSTWRRAPSVIEIAELGG